MSVEGQGSVRHVVRGRHTSRDGAGNIEASPAAGVREARALIVADDPLYGRGLKLLLEQNGGYQAIYVESLQRAGRFCAPPPRGARGAVVLLVVDEFGADALQDAYALRRQASEIALCVLAQRVELAVLQSLLADRASAFGLMLRERRPDVTQIMSTLDQVLHGASTIDPQLLERLIAGRGDEALPSTLTAMEEQVLELIALGLRNCEIAKRTRRSEKAIEKHIGRLFDKLGLHRATHAHLDRRVTAARLFYDSRAAGGSLAMTARA